MKVYLARVEDISQRLFPRIDATFYTPLNGGHDGASGEVKREAFLRLTERSLSRLERIMGWRLDPTGKLTRLLYFHKQALESELSGAWQRADYFWNTICRRLKQFDEEERLWGAIAIDLAGDATPLAAAEIKQRIICELFVDTHCALFNGYVAETEKLSPENRAFAHFDFVKNLIKLVDLSESEVERLLLTATHAQAALSEEAQNWEKAARVCTELLCHLPDAETIQNLWARYHLTGSLARLRKGNSEKIGTKNVRLLKPRIEELHQKHNLYPYNVFILNALGHLYHQQAINLAHMGELAEAIVAAQKSLTHFPPLAEAAKTRNTLIGAMEELQEKMRLVEAEVARNRKASLNKAGLRMREQARRGLHPWRNYVQSEQAAAGLNAFYTAQGRKAWHSLGLAVPADDWDEQAKSLFRGLSQMLAEPPESASLLPEAWEKMTAEDPLLGAVDRPPIIAYLEKRLAGEEVVDVAPADPVLPAPPPSLPQIGGLAQKRVRSFEPFSFWVFDGQDIRLKLQTLAAVILILLAGGLFLREQAVRQAHQEAYVQVMDAYEAGDDLALIEGAERYFVNKPFNGSDEQDRTVSELYAEAFVRWFTGVKGESSPDIQERITLYQTFNLVD